MVRRSLFTALLMVVVLLGTSFAPAAAPTLAKTKSKSSKSKSSQKSSKRSKSSKSKSSKKSSKSRKTSKRSTKKSRAAARRAAALAAKRRAAKLAAIRRHDESLRAAAATEIAKDRLTFEDPMVRRAAVEALGNRAGTVVVMDPNTGRVLSIVNQHMAIGTPVKPCSTIKPLVALAAMSERMIDESDTRTLKVCSCEMGMDDALAYSNNEYFQQLGRQLGLERLTSYARTFGFGEKSGINLPGESPGKLPESVADSRLGRVASHGDGIGITALQMAVFTSAIANGGSIYQPQVLAPNAPITPILRRQIDLKPTYRRAILEGMSGAVDYGTARRAQTENEDLAGKTGTCTTMGSWIGLFASVSNVESPNLVVVVITRGSTARGKYAADIAGKIYESLSERFGGGAHRPRRVSDVSEVDSVPTLSNRE